MAYGVERSQLGVGLEPARTVFDNGAVLLTKPTIRHRRHHQPGCRRIGRDPAASRDDVAAVARHRSRHRDALGRDIAESSTAAASRLDRLTAPVLDGLHLLQTTSTVLALLVDILVAPSLPEEEIATRKGEVITSIRQDEDNPAVRASETLMWLLYPDGHPYGRRTKGSIEIVERLTRDQLLRLHAERFAPSGLTAVVVGDVDPGRVKEVAARCSSHGGGPWRRHRLPP